MLMEKGARIVMVGENHKTGWLWDRFCSLGRFISAAAAAVAAVVVVGPPWGQ